ncbi:MAG: hypothetical protein ABFD82_10575 [Syntrophaceae bacterium]
MQGQLRKEFLSVVVKTQCAHCSRPMEIEIDSELNYHVKEKECNPIIFIPDVDLLKLKDESIINAF